MVIVDTSVWSEALRRRRPVLESQEALQELIEAGQVVLLDPIRQELLSGIKDEKAFVRLRNHLQAFESPSLVSKDYETAAQFFNRCRSKGIQGSNTDFLICAVAFRRKWRILTTDGDFKKYQKTLSILLY